MKSIYLLAALSLLTLGCSQENPRVVTTPNRGAALVGQLPFNPLQGRVITSWIDKPNATMSTLFGNDVAVNYARANAEHNYPAGSVLSLVTWNKQEDPRWFGGEIPKTPRTVEFVVVGASSDNRPTYSYQKYEGTPLTKVSAEDGATPSDRVSFLISQRAAVLP